MKIIGSISNSLNLRPLHGWQLVENDSSLLLCLHYSDANVIFFASRQLYNVC